MGVSNLLAQALLALRQSAPQATLFTALPTTSAVPHGMLAAAQTRVAFLAPRFADPTGTATVQLESELTRPLGYEVCRHGSF